MSKHFPKNCGLCGKTIRYGKGNLKAASRGALCGAETHDHDAKSEMHYAHTNGRGGSRQQFRSLSDEFWQRVEVKNKKGSRIVCYECHEVILHNPVLNETHLLQLEKLFSGKSFEEKISIFSKAIGIGLTSLLDSDKRLNSDEIAD